MLNNGKFICTCCSYITYNIGNYNRHLKSNKHFKKDSLDKLVGKNKNDLLHKIQYIENDSSENKKDSLDKLVGKNKNDLLHKTQILRMIHQKTKGFLRCWWEKTKRFTT